MKNLLLSSLVATLFTTAAVADELTPATAQAIIGPFYAALNQPAQQDVRALVEQVVSPDWVSCGSESDCKGREKFIGQLGGFGQLIPDLTWEIKEVVVAGDRIIVRGAAAGTPVGEFLGVPPSGKGFSIMSLDLHTIKDGQIVHSYHIEDWASAMRQLRGQ